MKTDTEFTIDDYTIIIFSIFIQKSIPVNGMNTSLSVSEADRNITVGKNVRPYQKNL